MFQKELQLDLHFIKMTSKRYVTVITLAINVNIKFLKHLKQGFRTTFSWKNYKSEIGTEPKNNNLDRKLDPTFEK